MPAKYRRKPGSRRYVDYTQAELEECLAAIRSKSLTQRAASAKYSIPRSTLKNKLARKYPNKPGGNTIFTEQEEMYFVAHITALSEYGFPITDFDLKIIIRDYLESQGRTVSKFKSNLPGKDWVKSFLSRNKNLTRRLANNIKRVRAQVSEDVIDKFIESLEKELENVPPENIYNYDETNLSDDPGKKTIICRRGIKYPETIVNATKTSYTVMFCGNAAGEASPPYIVYKSEHLWSTWTENGPANARYNRTKSGWMDSVTFEDWFINHLLVELKKKEGKKVVIGDNLASHINKRVLSECEKHNISFICLPPNATHILQPLDVAFFRPLKCKWRQILQDWKNTQLGKKLPTTPKDQFPRLLKKTLDSLTETKANLISGFRKTGIFPVNKEEPITRLPKQDRIVHSDLIASSFMEKLTQSRTDICPEKKTVKRKLNVPPGKSISTSDIVDAGPSGLQAKTKKSKTVMKKRIRIKLSQTPTDSEDELPLAQYLAQRANTLQTFESKMSCQLMPIEHEKATEDRDSPSLLIEEYLLNQDHLLNLEDLLNSQEITRSDPEPLNHDADFVHSQINRQEMMRSDAKHQNQDVEVVDLQNSDGNPSGSACTVQDTAVDDYVLVEWNRRTYPGQILSTCEEGALVSCMKKGKTFWRWPTIKDEQLYKWGYIICKIGAPQFEKKGCFSVPELNDK